MLPKTFITALLASSYVAALALPVTDNTGAEIEARYAEPEAYAAEVAIDTNTAEVTGIDTDAADPAGKKKGKKGKKTKGPGKAKGKKGKKTKGKGKGKKGKGPHEEDDELVELEVRSAEVAVDTNVDVTGAETESADVAGKKKGKKGGKKGKGKGKKGKGKGKGKGKESKGKGKAKGKGKGPSDAEDAE